MQMINSKNGLKRPLKRRPRNTVKLVLSSHSKRRPNIGLKDRLSLNAGQTYCRMLQESILQYFGPSLGYHLSSVPLFCLLVSSPLRQVLLYVFNTDNRLMQVTSTAECSPALNNHKALRPFLSICEWPLKTGFTVGFQYR